MEFDREGHVLRSPKSLYALAKANPTRLVDHDLMIGTPAAFSRYDHYCDFLEAVSERTGVHPRNLYLRGSCQIGFSIAPKRKAWTALRSDPTTALSDLDLVIVDEAYFIRFEREIQWWEARNPHELLRGHDARAASIRQQDRLFNCCRDDSLPAAVCIHHQAMMNRVAEMRHCGLHRTLTAFIYPDWLSARARYLFDLRELVDGVESGRLPSPGDEPIRVDQT